MGTDLPALAAASAGGQQAGTRALEPDADLPRSAQLVLRWTLRQSLDTGWSLLVSARRLAIYVHSRPEVLGEVRRWLCGINPQVRTPQQTRALVTLVVADGLLGDSAPGPSGGYGPGRGGTSRREATADAVAIASWRGRRA